MLILSQNKIQDKHLLLLKIMDMAVLILNQKK